MKFNNTLLAITVCLMAGFVISCNKIDHFLNKKSKLSDVRPSTLKDFRAILNNTNIMNKNYPGVGILGSDNYYLTSTDYSYTSERYRDAYTWSKNQFSSYESSNWNRSYERIEYCNIILDGLNKVDKNTYNRSEFETIKGEALFIKAFTYYALCQIFCKPYSKSTASEDLGLILRKSSDINEKLTRATVKETYQTIIQYFEKAIELLPNIESNITRPTKLAAKAALSKVYLCMQDYKNALELASECLEENDDILDFNNSSIINTESTYRFPQFSQNKEIIWYAEVGGNPPVWNYPSSLGIIDTALYGSYNDNDLRKILFFLDNSNGKVKNRGCYTGNGYNFSGIATNEMVLIKAECEVRIGKIEDALANLNALLIKRYKEGTYNRIAETNKLKLLRIVLNERRKELPFTGQLRWEDLRRLNTQPELADTLIRVINGKTYTLLPNSPRYVLPIPHDEIELSGVRQNKK